MIIGAVAATVYIEPVFTEDLDIVVPVDSGEDYYEVFRRASAVAERVEGMHLFFDDTPVQLFPTTMKPVYRDVLVQAEQAQVDGAAVKVAFAEHLVLLALEAYRPKDQVRIAALLPQCDSAILDSLLRGVRRWRRDTQIKASAP